MKRLTLHRALVDWLNRPVSRQHFADDDSAKAEVQRRQLVGTVAVTRHQVVLELDDRLARRLLEQIEEALSGREVSEAKRGQIAHARQQLLEAFPHLA